MDLTAMCIAAYIFGVLIGIFVTKLFPSTFGTLRVDMSDPEKDVYRIEIDDLNDLVKKKRITLRIDTKTKISQE